MATESHYQWRRGHTLASSYRGCGNKGNPAEINVQTLHLSNVATQRSDNEFDFFPEIPDEVKQSFNPSEWGF